MRSMALPCRTLTLALSLAAFWPNGIRLHAQIQVELKLPRFQYIAYEPVVVTLGITNLAGRDVDLRDGESQPWFGFEITGQEGQVIGRTKSDNEQPPLKIEAGKKVTQKINLTPLFQVQDFGTYHVRAHIYFGDLNKFFYSQTKVFEVTDARAVWQKTVGIPDANGVRTYSLLTNRFSDHTSLYVRVADRDSGAVYATYSLGRIIASDPPQAEIDHANQLHVLHCAAPRNWSYSRVNLNGKLISQSSFMESKTRPRLVHATDGSVAVHGGIVETRRAEMAESAPTRAPKLSDRPAEMPKDHQ
jgi:hypothetical protein